MIAQYEFLIDQIDHIRMNLISLKNSKQNNEQSTGKKKKIECMFVITFLQLSNESKVFSS